MDRSTDPGAGDLMRVDVNVTGRKIAFLRALYPPPNRRRSAHPTRSHEAPRKRDMIRERVKAGIAQARAEGKRYGRPQTAATKAAEVKRLYEKGWSMSQIARELRISRGSVIGMLK